MPSKTKKPDPGNSAFDATWVERFKELAGFSWPPTMDPAEWGIVLVAAGWSQERIEEFFRDELTLEDIVKSSEWPTFSASLLAGLGRWRYIEFLNEWRCSSDLKKRKNRGQLVKRACRLIEVTKDSEQTKSLQREQEQSETHRFLLRLVRGELNLRANQSDSVIPIEHRTRGITYKEAARYHSGKKKENASVYIKTQIKNGLLTKPIGKGRPKQYDIRQFPPRCHDKLRDPDEREPAKSSSAT